MDKSILPGMTKRFKNISIDSLFGRKKKKKASKPTKPGNFDDDAVKRVRVRKRKMKNALEDAGKY